MRKIVNGEHFLLLKAPFYKRRYTVDGDFQIGCLIGCQFCYYRWIEGTHCLIGTGKLQRVATPEQMVHFIENSKLILDTDILILSARSDISFQYKDLRDFLKLFKGKNKIFILHRGYFNDKSLEFAEDERVVYCTTITPLGYRMGWTPIQEKLQLVGILNLLKNGVPKERISIEVGPINEHTVKEAVKIVKNLTEMGINFLTYRGTSIGSFNRPKPDNQLKKIKFKTAKEDIAPEGHAYYHLKNFINSDIEKELIDSVNEFAPHLKLYRFTGLLYKEHFGIPVAYNRYNRHRKELGQFNTEVPVQEIAKFLEYLGYSVKSVVLTDEGYKCSTDEVITEDVAMTVGAKFNTCVLFNKYTIHPSMEILKFYKKNDLFYLRNFEEI